MDSEKTTKGYVYVLINSSIPNLVKIGKTTKEPNERVKELSSATGVATPFILVYHRHFNNCHSAERKIHTLLEDKGARFSDSREFFEISTTDAINIIQNVDDEREVGNELIDDYTENDIEKIGMLYYEKGNNYYQGNNDCFQDYKKAIEYYKKSAENGLIQAHYMIGFILQEHLSNIRMAINEYQKGAEKGDIRCYFHLAMIYMLERGFINERNADIAWEKFFANLDQLPLGTLLFFHRIYLSDALKKNFPIDSRWYPTIQSLKNELIEDIEQNRSASTYSDVVRFLSYVKQDTDVYSSIVAFRLAEKKKEVSDLMLMESAILIVQMQMGSTSLIQRKLKLGYNRAGRIMDLLEEFGIVGQAIGDKAREVKVKTHEELMQIFQRMGLVESNIPTFTENIEEKNNQLDEVSNQIKEINNPIDEESNLLEEENKQLEVESKQPEVASKENVKKKKSWLNKFFALLPSIVLLLIIGVPVILLIYWISESSILCLLALILLIFLPFK